jgi:hypothetical protein
VTLWRRRSTRGKLIDAGREPLNRRAYLGRGSCHYVLASRAAQWISAYPMAR